MKQTNHNGHVADRVPQMAPAVMTRDILQNQARMSPGFKRLTVVLCLLFLVGIVAFVVKAVTVGFSDRSEWGYYTATFAFLFTVAQAAPIVAISTRLTKAHWSRPFHRTAEAFALVGVFSLLLLIPLLVMLPSAKGRLSIWFVDAWREGFPVAAPHLWIILSMTALALCGLALLWASSRPDLAAVRDHSTGRRQRFYAILARQWRGDNKQWFTLRQRGGILGALYFMILVFTHFLISVDFSMSLIPGWKDSIYPAYHAVSGIQSGVAVLIVALFVLRQYGGMKNYLSMDQFWGLGKLLLTLSLIWAYFWWSEFNAFWYSRFPPELSVLQFIMFKSYLTPWVLSFILIFLLPLLFLIWSRVRKSILGPTLIAISVLIGTFFNKISTYVSAFSVEDITQRELHAIPPAILPNGLDILMILGTLAGAALVYIVAIKIFSPISLWDMKSFMLLRRFRKFRRTEVTVLAKPD